MAAKHKAENRARPGSMGRAGTHNRPAAAVVRCRLWRAGVVLYFTAEREPAMWAGAVPTAVVCALRIAAAPADRAARDRAWPLRHRFGLCNCDAQDRADRPSVLRFPASGVTVAGFVELREESQHIDRFVLRVDRIDGGRIEELPSRVRLSVKRGTAPPTGSFVEVKASLEPPLQPLEAGRKRANDSDSVGPLGPVES